MRPLLKVSICILVYISQLSAFDSTNILVVYFSKTGHTKLLAEFVAQGVLSTENVVVKMSSVENTTNEDVQKADAIILGSPVYNANVAPEIQKFINNWPFKGSPLKDKIGAAFVTAGGISAGEELVQLNLLHSMLVFGMIVVGGGNWQSAFGASAINSEKPFDSNGKPTAINKMFIEKAEALGKRVADLTVKLKHK